MVVQETETETAEEDFPSGRQFLLFALFMAMAMVVGAVIGVAIFGAPGLPGESPEGKIPFAEPDEVINVGLAEFTIAAVPVVVGRDEVIEFVVRNNGTIQHNFKIDGVDGVGNLNPGEERSFVFGPVQGDSLTAWCTVVGHRQQGMEIKLQVVDKPPEAKPPEG
jgi:nitrite reductase (NO-forming)